MDIAITDVSVLPNTISRKRVQLINNHDHSESTLVQQFTFSAVAE